jgi:hypothetical protein
MIKYLYIDYLYDISTTSTKPWQALQKLWFPVRMIIVPIKQQVIDQITEETQ